MEPVYKQTHEPKKHPLTVEREPDEGRSLSSGVSGEEHDLLLPGAPLFRQLPGLGTIQSKGRVFGYLLRCTCLTASTTFLLYPFLPNLVPVLPLESLGQVRP